MNSRYIRLQTLSFLASSYLTLSFILDLEHGYIGFNASRTLNLSELHPVELGISLQTYIISNFLVASAYVFVLTFT